MSSPATSVRSAEPGPGFWERVGLALCVSFFIGLPVAFVGVRLGFISSGDEGRWQPYTAFAGLLWATAVWTFVWPAARLRWSRSHAASATLLTGLVACMVVFLASIVWLFEFLIAVGFEP